MTPRKILWLLPTLFYAVFVFWYTDFGGPLRPEEIATFMTKMQARGVQPRGLAVIEKFMREDSGRQFLMVNIMDYNDSPPDVPGAMPGETAIQLMDRYMAYMWTELLMRACHPTVMGNAIAPALDVVGIENAQVWDAGALMRYRSRRSMMEIIANAAQEESHRFKLAAMNKTIAFPIETKIYLGDARLLLGLMLLSLTALLDGFLLSRKTVQL
jgi:hypothetical protein